MMAAEIARDTPRRMRAQLAEVTRQNILDVAKAEFVDKGLAGARIDEIAEKTNSSKRMIYYYFGSKEELYKKVLEQAYLAIRTREEERDLAAMGAEEALATLVELTFDYHLENPDFTRIVMNENLLHGVYISEMPELKARTRNTLAVLRGILDRGIADGAFREGLDPLDVHLTLSAPCFFGVANRYTLKALFDVDISNGRQRDDRRKRIVEAVLRYVRK